MTCMRSTIGSIGRYLLRNRHKRTETVRPAPAAQTGHAQATYDAAGNLTGLNLAQAQSAVSAIPSTFQFTYEWDEVGQLVHAERAPISGIAGDEGSTSATSTMRTGAGF